MGYGYRYSICIINLMNKMIIEIFPSKRVEGDKKTEIRIPSIDYARILKIRAIEQRMLDMICFLF